MRPCLHLAHATTSASAASQHGAITDCKSELGQSRLHHLRSLVGHCACAHAGTWHTQLCVHAQLGLSRHHITERSLIEAQIV